MSQKDYKIRRGDSFLCLENYEMEYEGEGEFVEVAYTKGKVYYSDVDGNITDNEFDVNHQMEGEDNFFEYFSPVGNKSDLSMSKLIDALKQSIELLMQTTEFDVLESFKLKVSELQKIIEENKK